MLKVAVTPEKQQYRKLHRRSGRRFVDFGITSYDRPFQGANCNYSIWPFCHAL